MRERPILFSVPMVRAILDGRKTQTRRVVKERHFPADFHTDALRVGVIEALEEWYGSGRGDVLPAPYGQPGDRLWVRETWALVRPQVYDSFTNDWSDPHGWEGPAPKERPSGYALAFAADDHPSHFDDRGFHWRPSIHMPRWASRLTLDVVRVRVERLQDISEADAQVEGVERLTGSLSSLFRSYTSPAIGLATARESFRTLWHALHGRESWDANPWVWVIEWAPLDAAVRAERGGR